LSAFGAAELLALEANVLIELDFARQVFSLDFNGQLRVIGLGTIGSTAGRFVLDTSSGVKFWGVMTVETDFSALEPYGVFLFGKGTIAINTTSEDKCETLTLPGLATSQSTTIPCDAPPTSFGAGTGSTRTFLIAAQSFLIEVVGQARIRPPGTDTDLVRLQGGFVLKIDPTEMVIFATAELSFGIGDAQLTYASATGLFILKTGEDGSNPGVAGYLKVAQSAGLGLPAVGSLFSASGSIVVMFNTTFEDQSFVVPESFAPLVEAGLPARFDIFKSAPGLDGQFDPAGDPDGEVYVVAVIQAELQIGPITLTGFIRIEAAADGEGGRFELTGAVSTEIDFIGALSGTINLNIYVGAKTGVVGRVQLSLDVDPGGDAIGFDFFTLEGDFLLEVNAVVGGTGPETVQTFMIDNEGKFIRNADGSLRVGQVTIDPGVKLRLSGKLTLLQVVELEGRFTLDITPTKVEVSLQARLRIDPIGSLEAAGAFRIDSSGLVLYANLTMNVSFGEEIGLRFSASARLEFNSTSSTKTLDLNGTPVNVRSGLLLRIEGSIEFLGFASASGYAEFSISPTETRILFGVAFSLGGLSFRADGGAEVAYGNDPGLALFLDVEATADAEIFRIEASGTLQINTTNSTRLGIAGNSFLLSLNGEVAILELLIFEAGFTVRVNNGGWRFDFNARIDFFGLVTIDGSGFLDSKGNFDITLQGRFVIGTDDFGLSGQATFRVWNVTTQSTSGNPIYDFGLSISASLRARLFGITLAGVGFNVTFTANNRETPSVEIKLSVTVEIEILFVTIEKTATFSLGYLQLPPPVFLAGDANGPDNGCLTGGSGSCNQDSNWNPDGDGILYLNVGSRAGHRNIGSGVIHEVYTVGDGGYDDLGRRLTKVSAFGRSNAFANVTSIQATTFDLGNDQLYIDSSITAPVTINMGGGDDVVTYAGNNAGTTINGGSGDDYIAFTGTLTAGQLLSIIGGDETTSEADPHGDFIDVSLSSGANIEAGGGDDYILGSAFRDVIDGGSGGDEIVGNGGNDTITGGTGRDKVVLHYGGLGSTVDGGGDNDYLIVSATTSGDVVDFGATTTDGSFTFRIKPATTQPAILVKGVENVVFFAGGGADVLRVAEMRNSGVGTLEVDLGGNDNAGDRVSVTTANGLDDIFSFTSEAADLGTRTFQKVGVTRTVASTTPDAASYRYMLLVAGARRGNLDTLRIESGDGNDRIDAASLGGEQTVETDTGDVTIHGTDLIALQFVTGAGNDVLVGSPWNDVLAGGRGNDRYTGGDGLDVFCDAHTYTSADIDNFGTSCAPGDAADIDTLVEQFDRD
ncbi:MAG TPA: calcium-binding protein, partial [Ilumatobacteraceae bacterium]